MLCELHLSKITWNINVTHELSYIPFLHAESSKRSVHFAFTSAAGRWLAFLYTWLLGQDWPVLLFYEKSCFPQYSSLHCFLIFKQQNRKTGAFLHCPAPPGPLGAFIDTCGSEDQQRRRGPQERPGPRLPAAARKSGHKVPESSREVVFPTIVNVAWRLRGRWGSLQALTQGCMARTGYWAGAKAERLQEARPGVDGCETEGYFQREKLKELKTPTSNSQRAESHTNPLSSPSSKDCADIWSRCHAPPSSSPEAHPCPVHLLGLFSSPLFFKGTLFWMVSSRQRPSQGMLSPSVAS